jgi:hypothetical protein
MADDKPKMTPKMKPMFLPGVEQRPQARVVHRQHPHDAASGAEYPQIWHMFAFHPKATNHLARFTQEIMRGPRLRSRRAFAS